MKNLLYWIWLSRACTPGSVTFAKLLNKFADAREIYEADADAIASAITSRSRDFSALTDKDTEKAQELLDFCMAKGVGILTYADEKFPPQLRCVSTPPVVLYYRGVLPDFEKEFFISVVGTRRLSDYGRKNAFTISHDLARAGAVVVSGMALGIDSVAHAGAIAANKPTVAVLGCGIDVCYPKQHLRLAREIVKSGCVITEYAPGTRPDGHNFPVRNRIISGLSSVTLVIEGKERSGAMITARHAKEQGRAVYALPGNVGNANSELSNILIKNGASLCAGADDIIRDYEKKSLGKLNPFELTAKANVNMDAVLRELKVSCVSSGDDIFKSPRSKKKTVEPSVEQQPNVVQKEPDTSGIDAETLKIYKRIPVGEECAVESLVDAELSLRVIMKGLLKLEMGRFVTMLPGERVRRNF